MTAISVVDLAKTWVAAQIDWATQIDLDETNEQRWAPIHAVDNLSTAQPELLWSFILEVLKLKPSHAVLGMLAASPLEDLIQDHGQAFLERIAKEAETNNDFAALLPMVLVAASDDLVTRQYVQLGCDKVRAAK